jgi:hypothetical protein
MTAAIVTPLDPNSSEGRAAEDALAAIVASVRIRQARERATASTPATKSASAVSA